MSSPSTAQAGRPANSFSTAPLELPTFEDRADVTRADLVFYDVDHRGPSYLAHVFLGQTEASADTPRDAEHGYAGYYTVLGHGGCFGGEGHCDTRTRYADAFDHRLRHPATPFVKALTVTDALAPALLDPKVKKIAVTVVIEPAEAAPVAPFELVRLLTYVD